LVLAAILAGSPLMAQTASLHGQVTDESGAIIPGAKVTLTGPSGFVKTTTSANDGSYTFAGVPPGSYTLQASAPDLALAQPRYKHVHWKLVVPQLEKMRGQLCLLAAC